MQPSVLLFLPIITGIIMGIMFGWEIGFGVAFLIGATSFYIANQFILAGASLLIAIILAVDSLRRIRKVSLFVSEFTVQYFHRGDRNTFPKPHDYQFSGTISIKVPSETAVRAIYLELHWADKKERITLMADPSKSLSMGYVLIPLQPLVKSISFQVYRETELKQIPTTALVIVKTTDWEKNKVIALINPQ